MSQRPIDLLPMAIRVRGEAGVRAGRYVGAVVLGVVALIALGTHARIRLDQVEEALRLAEIESNHVLATEAKANELEQRCREAESVITRYEMIAHPIDISAAIATMINDLPNDVTLDRIDLRAGARRVSRSPRMRGEPTGERPRRTVTGEIAGFAPTDQDIAELMGRLDAEPLFEGVSLDFSRTRGVREKAAREFRVSFRIDLESVYLTRSDDPPAEEVVRVE